MKLAIILRFVLAAALTGVSLFAQRVEVEEFVLDNGMEFLLLPRKGDPNVAVGWGAKVGSVNERPGVTGVAHLFEHMMFKGTRTIGTKDIDSDLATIEQLDALRKKIQAEEVEFNEHTQNFEPEDHI